MQQVDAVADRAEEPQRTHRHEPSDDAELETRDDDRDGAHAVEGIGAAEEPVAVERQVEPEQDEAHEPRDADELDARVET